MKTLTQRDQLKTAHAERDLVFATLPKALSLSMVESARIRWRAAAAAIDPTACFMSLRPGDGCDSSR